jgi:hypothetical protein
MESYGRVGVPQNTKAPPTGAAMLGAEFEDRL